MDFRRLVARLPSRRTVLISFDSIAAVALLGAGSDLAYREVGQVTRCIEARAELNAAEKDQQAAQAGASQSKRGGVARQEQEERRTHARHEDARLKCAASPVDDDAMIGLAGLWLAFYAFAAALLFGVVTLIASFIPLANPEEGRPAARPMGGRVGWLRRLMGSRRHDAER